MTKILKFEVSKATILENVSDFQFATAEIDAFSSGENLHDMRCSVDVLKETSATLYEKPIIFSWKSWGDDFDGHSEKSLIAGFVSPDTATFYEREDGRIALNVKAKIWKYYAPDFVETFEESETGNKSVSVEMELFEVDEPDESGISDMLSFAYTAVTVLGDHASPASPDANMQMVSFSDVKKQIRSDYIKEFGGYKNIDFSVPDGVKKSAQAGIEKLEESEISVHVVAKAMGNHLSGNDVSTPKKMSQMEKFFRNYSPEEGSEKKEILWLLYGGKDGNEWSTDIINKMSAEDERITAHFETISEDSEGIHEREEAKPMTKKVEKNEELEEAETPAVTEDFSEEAEGTVETPAATEEFAEEDEEEIEDENVTMEEDEEDDFEEGEEYVEPEPEEMEFALTAAGIDERANIALSDYKYMEMYDGKEYEYRSYWVATHDDEYVYVYCYEDSKIYRMGYSLDGETMSFEISKEEEVYLSSEYVLASDAIKVMEEFEALKEFKETIDNREFEYEVNATLNLQSVKDNLTDEDREEFISKSKEFTIDTLDGWKNSVKAFAFDVAEKNPKPIKPKKDDDGTITYANTETPVDNTKPRSVWDKFRKKE